MVVMCHNVKRFCGKIKTMDRRQSARLAGQPPEFPPMKTPRRRRHHHHKKGRVDFPNHHNIPDEQIRIRINGKRAYLPYYFIIDDDNDIIEKKEKCITEIIKSVFIITALVGCYIFYAT